VIRKIVIAGICICIGLGIWSSNHLTYNFNTDPLAFSSTEQKEEFEAYQNAFKTYPDAITIGLVKNNRFDTYEDFLELQTLTDSILTLTGINKIESVEKIKIPRRERLFVMESPFLRLDHKKGFQKTYSQLNHFSDITQKFLSKDRSGVCFYVFLDKEHEPETISAIKKLLDKSPFDDYHILGASAFEAEGKEVLEKETLAITLAGCLLIILSMYFFIPSLKRVGTTLLFTGFNVCVTLIFMYLFRIQITTFTSIIPCVIAIFSFTDILHILFHYDKEKERQTPHPQLQSNLFKVIGTPLILTTVSNLIGFGIFFFNGGIQQITKLALAASFGIVFAYASSRFILPYTLTFNSNKRIQKRLQSIEAVISNSVNTVSSHYKSIVFTFVILYGLICAGVFSYSTVNMHYYEKDNSDISINKACSFYDAQFQGIRDIEVVVQSKTQNILNAKTVKTIGTIERYLTENYGCKSTFSINTIIKRFNRFLNRGRPEFYDIPDNLSSSFFVQMKDKEDELGMLSIISDDQKTTRIVGSLPDIGTANAKQLNKALNTFLFQFNSNEHNVFINGKAYLFDENVTNLTRYVLITIAIVLILIGLFTGVLFKSIGVGISSFLANSLPILVGIFLFYVFHVELNPSSVFMLSIVMGIALDDSIYILGYLYKSKRTSKLNRTTLVASLKTNSAPLLITSVVLGLSFLSLSLSSYQSIFSFGIIMSISLFFAFLSDMFFMPSLLYWGMNKKQ